SPVHDVRVASPRGHTVTFPLPRDRGAYAVVTRRTELDRAILQRAAEVGAEVRDGVTITDLRDRGGHIELSAKDGSTHRGRFVIAADGMWSPLRKMMGLTIPGYRGEWHAFRQ